LKFIKNMTILVSGTYFDGVKDFRVPRGGDFFLPLLEAISALKLPMEPHSPS